MVTKRRGIVGLLKRSLGISTRDCCGGDPKAPRVGDPDHGTGPCCDEPADPKTVRPGREKADDGSDRC
ncbi:MAG: hypothetical protein QME70_12980 [Bacillota bacterium]|nr:hypothetical protein [Bacillota bacterium]